MYLITDQLLFQMPPEISRRYMEVDATDELLNTHLLNKKVNERNVDIQSGRFVKTGKE